MRVLICGGRTFTDPTFTFPVLDAIHARRPITLVIEGEAQGADLLARKWAESRGILILPFPADWELHGKRAGPVRNHKMLREGKPDLVVALPGGRGTAHMVKIAQEAGVKVLDLARRYKDWWSTDPFASHP